MSHCFVWARQDSGLHWTWAKVLQIELPYYLSMIAIKNKKHCFAKLAPLSNAHRVSPFCYFLGNWSIRWLSCLMCEQSVPRAILHKATATQPWNIQCHVWSLSVLCPTLRKCCGSLSQSQSFVEILVIPRGKGYILFWPLVFSAVQSGPSCEHIFHIWACCSAFLRMEPDHHLFLAVVLKLVWAGRLSKCAQTCAKDGMTFFHSMQGACAHNWSRTPLAFIFLPPVKFPSIILIVGGRKLGYKWL